MITVEYCRHAGRQLTYLIRADEWGGYTVLLAGKELLRGRDPLSAYGRRQMPTKRKATGAVEAAKSEIERLCRMDEI